MDSHLPLKKYFFFLLIIFTAFIFNISCSNNVPEIKNTKLCIIFDYETMESEPQARLGVFVESISNPRRFDTITVAPKGTDYSWEVNELVLADNGEQKYCGAVNLVMPQQEQFPTGEYNIQFIQSDEENTDVKVGLFYDKALYNVKGNELAQYMNRTMGSRMIKIYDKEKKILYYGPRSVELRDSRNIWNTYREAAEFQESWINGNIICNLPVQKVEPGN